MKDRTKDWKTTKVITDEEAITAKSKFSFAVQLKDSLKLVLLQVNMATVII